ncbi:metalloregulator ArsR/SmtB family transcription factor [Calothrix sp. UHCC 0171]|uniref:ArsR/SmtB family transcription factor n=1 Tax=Calothrix sp. UHCC 0171 TaxID=3110245 RepID=UPI002B20735C|nr:metalloregulator ArsR/SmtB family transcription factor [Calothrix sp. UHCC 0171]MEA5574394.1 metalloregulator ArsR/SmtB family transcription factor [Calothrix sp. UHCC 0171]
MNPKDVASSSDFCAHQLKVLADTTRLSVLKILMEGPKHVGELNSVLQLEQSLLSHHLKILREAGFVEATRDGKAVLYHFVPTIRQVNAVKAIDLGCCLLSFE